MQHAYKVFFLVLFLWLRSIGSGESLRTTLSPYQKMENSLVKPSNNVTQAELRELMDHCKPLGMKCRRAEECCSRQCKKRGRCVFYIFPTKEMAYEKHEQILKNRKEVFLKNRFNKQRH